MQIIQDIAGWVSQQPAWMSDCVRRLVVQGVLSQDDRVDLVALVKSHHGFKDPEGRQAAKLDASQVPAVVQDGVDVSLKALREPKHLNAIDSGQSLSFQADGLTVVYGYNGVGKSGYARALKRACRARTVEDIFPNVYSSHQAGDVPSAAIDWLRSGEEKTHGWTATTVSPAELSQISVFDAHCARVFVDSQAKVLFVPNGLEVMHGLADAMQWAQKQLEHERSSASFDFSPLSALHGSHVVGRAMAKLGRSSNHEEFEKLAAMTEEELAELEYLRKLFRDEDPAKQAAAVRRLLLRLSTLLAELTARAGPLQDASVQELREAFVALIAAEGAAKLVEEKLKGNGVAVLGTGSEPWELLLRSAIDFATQTAYPGSDFPGPEQDAHCVLCQQPLTVEAAERLKVFVQFLEDDAQQRFNQQRNRTKELYRAISGLKFETFPSDVTLLDELAEGAPELVAAVRTYVQALHERQLLIMKRASERLVEELPALPQSPIEALDAWVDARTKEAVKLEAALTGEERAKKQALMLDLDARVALGPLLPKVLEAIRWYRRDHAFAESIKACGTTGVTKKTNELYEAHVTEELRAAFARELEQLGMRHQPVSLEMTGQKGTRVQQLKLGTLPRFAKTKVSAILSEGEQRVVALALFLAEIGVEPGGSGLIFDDPVSSLDHVRRERIAYRLVVEAKKRQVIVFTHDLAFALALTDIAIDLGIKFAHRHLSSTPSKKGLCQEDLPFEGKKLKNRIGDLRALAARARKTLEENADTQGYDDLVRGGYRRLRDTWEQLVEDLLLQGTVRRFRRSVETTRLRYVAVEDSDASAVYNGMGRCSNFTHEGGTEAPPPLPEPEEFLADVEALAAFAKQLEERAKETEERRKQQGLGADGSLATAA